MERIASFAVNHDALTPGMYTSRIDGDIVTYDIRVVRPNAGVYLDTGEMHTVEHLFATYVRNSPQKDAIIYFGPMGCRTGFYFLVRDTLTPAQAIRLTREALRFIAGYEGEIPGASPAECGNAADHSLPKAKALAARMLPVLEHWTEADLAYKR